MYAGGAAAFDILYYEVLDMPLEQLEQLKTFKVWLSAFACRGCS